MELSGCSAPNPASVRARAMRCLAPPSSVTSISTERTSGLASVACAADGSEDLTFELYGNGLGFLLELEIIGFKLRALRIESRAIFVSRA